MINFKEGKIWQKLKELTEAKRSYTKPGSKRGRGVKQTWKK